MISYKFITQDKSQDIEAMSLKKAMISFNTKAGDAKEVVVEWKSRKKNTLKVIIFLMVLQLNMIIKMAQ